MTFFFFFSSYRSLTSQVYTITNLVSISMSVNLFLPQCVKEEERTLHPIPLPPPPPDVSAIINCATVAPLCFGFTVQPKQKAEHCLQFGARRPQRGSSTSFTLWCVLNKALARTFPSSPLLCTSFSLCFLMVNCLLLQSDNKWSLYYSISCRSEANLWTGLCSQCFLYRGLWILFCEFKLFDAYLAWLKFNHQFEINPLAVLQLWQAQLRYQPPQLITEDERETHRWLIFTSLLILQRFLEWDALGEKEWRTIKERNQKKNGPKKRLRNFLW